MQLFARVGVMVAVGVMLIGGIMAWTARGSAILLELGTGVARVLCL